MTRQLIEASGKDLPTPISVNVDSIKMMTAYSHSRDKAVGLRLSKHTRGLVWYGEEKTRELSKAIVKKGILDSINRQMKKIMAEVETSQPDRQRELLIQARALQYKARQVNNGL